MRKELEQVLIEKYPNFFKNKDKSPKESLMCFGCEHGDGWFSILENLCGYLKNLIETKSFILPLKEEFKTEINKGYISFHCPNVIFDQVKEKYGTLRVYWHFEAIDNFEKLKAQLTNPDSIDESLGRYSDTIENAIDFSEYLSSITCEVTGNPGQLYSEGWCVTLCKEEAIKRFGFDPLSKESKEQEKL